MAPCWGEGELQWLSFFVRFATPPSESLKLTIHLTSYTFGGGGKRRERVEERERGGGEREGERRGRGESEGERARDVSQSHLCFLFSFVRPSWGSHNILSLLYPAQPRFSSCEEG